MFQSNFEFRSPQDRIILKTFFLYILTVGSVVLLFFMRGFDGEEVVLPLFILLPTTVVYGVLFFKNVNVFPAHCLTPADGWINFYFAVTFVAIWVKGLAPNWLPFKFMLPIFGVAWMLFNLYILILHFGYGKKTPEEEIQDWFLINLKIQSPTGSPRAIFISKCYNVSISLIF